MPCRYCGTTIDLSTTRGRAPAHCYSAECIDAHIDTTIAERVVQEGDCLIWTGAVASPKNNSMLPGTPLCRVAASRGKRPKTKCVRVACRLLEKRGEPVPSQQRLYTSCENPRCVLPDHQMRIDTHSVTGALDCIFLDPAPLHGAVRRWVQHRMGEEPLDRNFFRLDKKLDEAMRKGRVSLALIDQLCIDYLGVNPVLIYGMEFLEAA